MPFLRSLISIVISILLLAATAVAHSQPITGKVIGITDGDTITVLRQNDRTQHKIRLYGIDCPESHQANYDTTLGSGMIVFSSDGTHEHNFCGYMAGYIRLRAWLGFGKNIAVNSNGFVSEGVYPEY